MVFKDEDMMNKQVQKFFRDVVGFIRENKGFSAFMLAMTLSLGGLVSMDRSNLGIYPTTSNRSVYIAGEAITIDANLDEMTPEQMRIDLEESIVHFKKDAKKGYPTTFLTKVGYFLRYKKLPVASKYFPVEAAKKYAAENLD